MVHFTSAFYSCGDDGFQINERQISGTGQLFWKDIFFVAMHYQSLTAINQAGLLIGRDNVVRLDRPEGAVPIELDDWKSSAQILPDEARSVVEGEAPHIKEKFFSTKPESTEGGGRDGGAGDKGPGGATVPADFGSLASVNGLRWSCRATH